ncbi:MAG: CehA/McbA family metallohydrolase [Planctomycetota bacterium]|jgi:hypothetical protein
MATDNLEFRYNTSGKWLKGNTHLHSTESDGGKTIAELAEMYAGAGYDFIFITDHWISSDLKKSHPDAPLLLIDGNELDGRKDNSTFHIVCLGKTEGLNKEDGLDAAVKKAREQGAVIIMAHPRWCANKVDDAFKFDFDGVEIYNHVTHYMNGKSCGLTYWDAMLAENTSTLNFASDDSHLKPKHLGWNGGWITVNTDKLDDSSILSAIKTGNYYSSCGPEFKSIKVENNTLIVDTSPVEFIRLNSQQAGCKSTRAEEGTELTHVEIDLTIPKEWDYMYLEIEDKAGKRAWTNTLFV